MKNETKMLLMRAVVDERTKEALKKQMIAKYTSPEFKAAVMQKLTHKWKGSVKDQWVDFKYWLKIWDASMSMTSKYEGRRLKGEQKKIMSEAMLNYPWLIDMLKTNHLATKMTEGRNGAPLKAIKMILLDEVISTVRSVQNVLLDPENTVMAHAMVPNQIFQAMGLKTFTVEEAANVIGLDDQHSVEKYLDAMYNLGLPDNTCTYSTQTPGMFALGDYPTKAACMVAASVPCEAHFEGYSLMSKATGLPTYWLDIPYDFNDEASIKAYVEDLKGLIAFLEENTGHKMDWNKLHEVCARHNRILELELERWELNRAENPPMPDDAILLAHMQAFHLDTSTEADVKLFEELVKLTKEAYVLGKPAAKNIKYKTVMWSAPAYCYPYAWNWLERCWGVEVLNDMESFGEFEPIDTSTPDSMLTGIAKYWCHGSMSRHLRGPAENWIESLEQITALYGPDFVLNLNHNNCRGHQSFSGYLTEWSRKNHTPFCNVTCNMYDTRVCSRQGIRDQINAFMMNVMHAEPLDKSLLVIDDGNDW